MTKVDIKRRVDGRRWIGRWQDRAAVSGVEVPAAGHHRIDRWWWSSQALRVPFARVHCVQDGAIEMQIDGIWHRANQGELLWVSPGVPHRHRLPEGVHAATVTYAQIKTYQAGRPCRFEQDLIRIRDANSPRLCLEQIVASFQRHVRHGEAVRQGLAIALIAWVLERCERQQQPPPRRLTEAQQRALEHHVCRSQDAWLSPSDLAQALQLSPGYFRRVFKGAYQTTPQAWLKRKRIERAAHMLRESPQSIAQIAYTLGYSDLSYFAKQFRDVMRCSPRAWRQNPD